MEEETVTPPANNDAELAQLRADVEAAATALLAGVPDNMRALIPTALSAPDRIKWFNEAKAAGAFKALIVPATDGGVKPTITPKETDPASLPVFARIAAGYRK